MKATQISRSAKRASFNQLVRGVARVTRRPKAEVMLAMAPTTTWHLYEGLSLLQSVAGRFEEYTYSLDVDGGQLNRWPTNSGKTIADTALIEYDL